MNNKMKGSKMKNVVLLTVAVATLGFAKAGFTKNEPCKRLEKMETYLKDSVKVTAEQAAKIKTAHANACTKFEAIKVGQQTEEEKKVAMREVQKNLKAEYKTILTAEQQAKLKDKGGKMRKQKGEHKKGKNAHKPMDPAKKVEKMSQKMKEKYGLSDDQMAKVKSARQTMLTTTQAIKTDSTLSKKDKGAKMKAAKESYNKSMQSILTAEQYALWQKDAEEMKDKAKEKRKDKKVKK